MNKRLISLLLVVMMICTLLPMSVLATDTDSDGTAEKTESILDAQSTEDAIRIFIDAAKDLLVTDQREKITPDDTASALGENGMVAVPVVGKELSDIITNGDLFGNIQKAMQVRLSGKSVIPEVKVTITGTDEKTSDVQNQELVPANYSIFKGVEPDVDIDVTLEEFVKSAIKLARNLIQRMVPDQLEDLLETFGITFTDEEIDALIENSKTAEFTKTFLTLVGTGKLHYTTLILHLDRTIDVGNGLGLDVADCGSIDTFANALYNKYGKDFVDTTLKDIIRTAASDFLAQYAGLAYNTYVAEKLVPGDYTVSVEDISRQGFVTSEKDEDGKYVRTFEITVEKGKVTFVGDERSVSTDGMDLRALLLGETEDTPEAAVADESEDSGVVQENPIVQMIQNLTDLKADMSERFGDILDDISNISQITIPKIGSIKLPFTVYITLTFKGLWLDRVEPAIGFSNQDLGGNPITASKTDNQQGTFIMVDRDQLILVMEAMLDAGKDTFENVVNGLKEVYTDDENAVVSRDEFVQMHRELVAMKESEDGTQQISFEAKKLLPILRIYVKMMDIPSVWKDFMAKDVRFPAVLEATADADGAVQFTEDSNVTLTWMLDEIVKLADFSNEAIQELSAVFLEDDAKLTRDLVKEICSTADLSENMQTLLAEILIKLIELGEDGGDAVVALLNASAPTIKSTINTWIYPILQNDALFRTMFFALGLEHAILTDKMPDSYYLMLQKEAPEGYMRNPMVYTIKLDWDEHDWLYAKVVNLGIIMPYFAEDYYTFLRNNSIAKTSDAILNRISSGKYETLIEDIISGKVNATDQVVTASATGIAFQSWIMYNFMGGQLIYDEQDALQNDLVKWIKAKGNTAQNLLGFGNEIYQRSKAVVTADLTLTEKEDLEHMWAFYNASKSIKENIVVQATAIMKGISGSIVTDGSKVNGAVKSVIEKVIEGAAKIDTTSKLAAAVDQAKQKISETATKVATSLITTAIKKTAALFSSLFKGLKG